jgi:hypothetical protein
MSEQNEQPTNSLELVPAKVMREARRLIVNTAQPEYLAETLRAVHQALCLQKEKAPVKGLEEKQ